MSGESRSLKIEVNFLTSIGKPGTARINRDCYFPRRWVRPSIPAAEVSSSRLKCNQRQGDLVVWSERSQRTDDEWLQLIALFPVQNAPSFAESKQVGATITARLTGQRAEIMPLAPGGTSAIGLARVVESLRILFVVRKMNEAKRLRCFNDSAMNAA
ncbi:hypothetical protein QA640_38705 [Bradyrhizobium sp. CB82]|uniref:hypothetical protein n=1 Tax=Bradyrhizobium sp. CB82 TaxID=3039159 RepID=UPI0024B1B9FB|nr:hypothetical protein [Bradyrhizobium sp. CB82]WFU40089.1 hypothetical protein QA640_38705 [Bradyrhizobium sp. CB82]